MNKTTTPTSEKKVFSLRLPPDLYEEVHRRVQEEKLKGNYAYSINDFLTQIIEEGLKKAKRGH